MRGNLNPYLSVPWRPICSRSISSSCNSHNLIWHQPMILKTKNIETEEKREKKKNGTSWVHVTMWRSFFLESSFPTGCCFVFFMSCIFFIRLLALSSFLGRSPLLFIYWSPKNLYGVTVPFPLFPLFLYGALFCSNGTVKPPLKSSIYRPPYIHSKKLPWILPFQSTFLLAIPGFNQIHHHRNQINK